MFRFGAFHGPAVVCSLDVELTYSMGFLRYVDIMSAISPGQVAAEGMPDRFAKYAHDLFVHSMNNVFFPHLREIKVKDDGSCSGQDAAAHRAAAARRLRPAAS